MTHFLPDFSFPLLSKDLIEQAQRRRTYILRTIAALAIYLVPFFVLFNSTFFGSIGPLGSLGVGKEVLHMLFFSSAWAIHLVVPALTCGAIAGERERNSWNLLRTTRLGDSAILWEKYLSCIVTASTFLILSVPIMIIAYPLGGITLGRIIDAFWCLWLCSLYVGAAGLCCSAWCRTVVGALICAYLLLIIWIVAPDFILLAIYRGVKGYDESLLHRAIIVCFPMTGEEAWLPWLLFWRLQQVPSSAARLPLLVRYSIPTLAQTAFLLYLARLGIARPIETGGRSFWKSLFLALDGWFKRINQNRFTRGREFQIHRTSLPVDHPIAWRESSRVLFNHPVYRLRLIVGLLALITAIMAIIAEGGTDTALTVVNAVIFLLGCIALSVNAAGLFSRERNRQTLDVLLTTPISSREILKDKLAGVRYWHAALIVLSLLILFVRGYLSGFFYWQLGPSILMSNHHTPLQFFSDLVALIYLPRVVIWVSVAIGLRCSGHMGGVLSALGLLGAWAAVGILIATLGATGSDFDFLIAIFGAALSPFYVSSICFLWQSYYLRNGWPVMLIVANAIFYWVLASWLKRRCRSRIDQALGRLEVNEVPMRKSASAAEATA